MESITSILSGAKLGRSLGAASRRITASTLVVRGLLQQRSELRAKGFAKAIRGLFPNEIDMHELARQIIPDAFGVYPEDREVNLIEVVDTHPISKDKGELIGKLADAMEGEGWTLGVACYDASGNLTSHIPAINYLPYYTATDREYNVIPSAVAASKDDRVCSFEELAAIMGKMNL